VSEGILLLCQTVAAIGFQRCRKKTGEWSEPKWRKRAEEHGPVVRQASAHWRHVVAECAALFRPTLAEIDESGCGQERPRRLG
jgi:hypothetical protein